MSESDNSLSGLSGLSAAQRAQIERAKLHADEAIITTLDDAVRKVLTIFETVTDVYSVVSVAQSWSPERLQSETDQELDTLIDRAHVRHVGDHVTRATFATAVHRAWRTSRVWMDARERLETTLRELIDTAQSAPVSLPPTPTPKTRTARRFPRRAAWLKEQMRLANNSTPNRLQELGGPHGKTIRKILNGVDVRKDLWPRLVQALNAALDEAKQPHVKISDIPRK